MKKVLILIISVFVVLVGFLIYLMTYGYDKNHFGESFEIYADPTTCTIPMIAETDGEETLITPYNRYQVYVVLTRGKGELKKHLFETVTEGRCLTFRIGEDITIKVYEDPDSEDRVYYTVDDKGKKKYYSLENYKTMIHLLEAISIDAGNLKIKELTEGAALEEKKALANGFFESYTVDGYRETLKEYGDTALAEYSEDLSARTYLQALAGELQRLGSFKGVDEFLCYTTESEDQRTAMFGAASFEKGFRTFMMYLDSDGKVTGYDLF